MAAPAPGKAGWKTLWFGSESPSVAKVATPVGFWAMGGWLQQFAYRVPLSAWTFLLAGAAAILIAWLTVSYQSYTVARAKPAGALQYE